MGGSQPPHNYDSKKADSAPCTALLPSACLPLSLPLKPYGIVAAMAWKPFGSGIAAPVVFC